MKHQCFNCKAQVKVTKNNTKLHLFTAAPWFSFVAVKCACGVENQVFLWPSYDHYIAELPEGTPVIDTRFAPDALVHEWEEVFDIHPIQEQFVSERQLRMVAFLAWLLEHREREING